MDLFKYDLPTHSGHRAGTNLMCAHNANTANGIGTKTAKGSCPERRKNEDPPIRMKVGISVAIRMCNQVGMVVPLFLLKLFTPIAHPIQSPYSLIIQQPEVWLIDNGFASEALSSVGIYPYSS